MGIITKSISFFSDEITIKPHSCSLFKHLNKSVSIRTFAKSCKHGQVSLEQDINNGEYIAHGADGMFMQGPEV